MSLVLARLALRYFHDAMQNIAMDTHMESVVKPSVLHVQMSSKRQRRRLRERPRGAFRRPDAWAVLAVCREIGSSRAQNSASLSSTAKRADSARPRFAHSPSAPSLLATRKRAKPWDQESIACVLTQTLHNFVTSAPPTNAPLAILTPGGSRWYAVLNSAVMLPPL